MNSLLGWLDQRTGYKQILNHALYENVPGGSRWRYVWGSTLTFTFMVQRSEEHTSELQSQ